MQARIARMCLLFLLISCYPRYSSAQYGSPAPSPVDVIISTDLATGLNGGWRGGYSDIDDGLAVAMAYFSGRFNIRGVVVTFGNNYVQPEFEVASTLLHKYMGTNIPVLEGASIPLYDPPLQSITIRDPKNPDTLKTFVCAGNQGIEFMHAELQKKPATILALGPLTDIACLVTQYPGDAIKIQKVIAIMGRAPNESFTIEGITGLSDFNMRRDSAAAAALLQTTKVPIVLMGFSVTSSDLITSKEVQEHFSGSSALAQFFLKSANNWLVQWNDVYKFHEGGFHPWDQNAVFYAMNPSAYKCAAGDVNIVSCGAPYTCAGQSSGFGLLCPSIPSPMDKCSVQTYSPQWLDSQGEHAQLWVQPAKGEGRVTFCTAYSSDEAKALFHVAALNVLPPGESTEKQK